MTIARVPLGNAVVGEGWGKKLGDSMQMLDVATVILWYCFVYVIPLVVVMKTVNITMH